MSSVEDEESRRRRLEVALEVKSLRRIVSAYLNYPEAAEEDIKQYEGSFKKIPFSHKILLSHLPLKFQRLRWCIAQNSYFIFEMLKAFEPPLDMSADAYECEDKIPDNVSSANEESDSQAQLCDVSNKVSVAGRGDQFSNSIFRNSSALCVDNQKLSSPSPDWLDPSLQLCVPLADVDKVRSIIRNIVRDWTAEGQKERDECFTPILGELKRLYPQRSGESPPTCLVPGAGLGRLALEISCLGFVSEGNEFSYYMMICSSFILNKSQEINEWTIYPWIHNNCNSLSDSDQLRPVSFPDVHPASAGITEGFSMCGGDFVEVYRDPIHIGNWDAVVTCFFIDTAHNIVEYIEIISRILKDDGVWINLGPLLYHFAESYDYDDVSIDLSLEDVKRVACHYGFEIEKDSTVTTTYSTNPRSMMQSQYHAAFWTMRKKPQTDVGFAKNKTGP